MAERLASPATPVPRSATNALGGGKRRALPVDLRDLLEEHGYIRGRPDPDPNPTGGRPAAPVYEVNPSSTKARDTSNRSDTTGSPTRFCPFCPFRHRRRAPPHVVGIACDQSELRPPTRVKLIRAGAQMISEADAA
jgi:hypothetical protein